jgi:RimJ/RimL family protein N-acetyltransferase
LKQILTPDLQIRELLKYSVLQYMIDTLFENPKLGKIYIDDESNPKTCILSLKHLLFFGGTLTQDTLDFLSTEIFTDDIRNKGFVFYMIYTDELWRNALVEIPSIKCTQDERSLYVTKPSCTFDQQYFENVIAITSDLLNSNVNNLSMIFDEVIGTGTYTNMEDFIERGIGFSPIINNKVCGFCTSEYPSKDAVAIGIEVLDEFQRKGYAKAMTKSFLSKAAHRGLTVYWESWKNNLPSINTALSCKFEKVADYPMLFVRV